MWNYAAGIIALNVNEDADLHFSQNSCAAVLGSVQTLVHHLHCFLWLKACTTTVLLVLECSICIFWIYPCIIHSWFSWHWRTLESTAGSDWKFAVGGLSKTRSEDYWSGVLGGDVLVGLQLILKVCTGAEPKILNDTIWFILYWALLCFATSAYSALCWKFFIYYFFIAITQSGESIWSNDCTSIQITHPPGENGTAVCGQCVLVLCSAL